VRCKTSFSPQVDYRTTTTAIHLKQYLPPMATDAAAAMPAPANFVDPASPTRPPRGSSYSRRGSRRGGQNGPRGATGQHPRQSVNPTEPSSDWTETDPSDMSEEVTQLKAKYGQKLDVLRDIFPDWTTEDLLFALQEADGDVETATGRIASGLAKSKSFLVPRLTLFV